VEFFDMDGKTTLRMTRQGVYFVEIPQNFIRITKLREGDTIEFIMGESVSIKKDDLILRKVP
jgi:PDZ domain-containing secreted protein